MEVEFNDVEAMFVRRVLPPAMRFASIGKPGKHRLTRADIVHLQKWAPGLFRRDEATRHIRELLRVKRKARWSNYRLYRIHARNMANGGHSVNWWMWYAARKLNITERVVRGLSPRKD